MYLGEEDGFGEGDGGDQLEDAKHGNISSLELNPVEQKVNPKEKEVVGDIGVRKRTKRQFKDTTIPKQGE